MADKVDPAKAEADSAAGAANASGSALKSRRAGTISESDTPGTRAGEPRHEALSCGYLYSHVRGSIQRPEPVHSP